MLDVCYLFLSLVETTSVHSYTTSTGLMNLTPYYNVGVLQLAMRSSRRGFLRIFIATENR